MGVLNPGTEWPNQNAVVQFRYGEAYACRLDVGIRTDEVSMHYALVSPIRPHALGMDCALRCLGLVEESSLLLQRTRLITDGRQFVCNRETSGSSSRSSAFTGFGTRVNAVYG